MYTTAKKNLLQFEDMQQALAGLARQAWPILLSALAAAGLTFVQSLVAHAGFCPAPALSPNTVGVLGGGLKAAHQAVVYLAGGRT